MMDRMQDHYLLLKLMLQILNKNYAIQFTVNFFFRKIFVFFFNLRGQLLYFIRN